MPSMSYCMFENTSNEMSQCINTMQEVEDIKELQLNQDEKIYIVYMEKQCKAFLAEYERLIQNGEV